MDTIKIRKKISGETIRIRELAGLKGKTVSIIIYPDPERPRSKKNRSRVPSWIGKYTTGGNLADDRSSIYSK